MKAFCIAMLLFVFNAQGALLLQQRHADKRLGLYWSNSCCVILAPVMELAVGRRLLSRNLGCGPPRVPG